MTSGAVEVMRSTECPPVHMLRRNVPACLSNIREKKATGSLTATGIIDLSLTIAASAAGSNERMRGTDNEFNQNDSINSISICIALVMKWKWTLS